MKKATSKDKLEVERPSVVAGLIWLLGVLIIAVTITVMIEWQGWTQNANDALLVLVAFATGINSIVIGALVDMQRMRYKRKRPD